jgi:hypothetical protein
MEAVTATTRATRAETACVALAADAELVSRLAASAAHALQLGLPADAADELVRAQDAAWRLAGLAEDALRLCRGARAVGEAGYCPHCDKTACIIREDGTHAGCGRRVAP